MRRLKRLVWTIVPNAAQRSRQKKSGEPIISCMVDRIKEVNERGFSSDVCDKLNVDD